MEASALTHASRRGLLARRSPLLKLQGDEKLVAMVRAGNAGAFEAIVDRYQGRLLGFCRQMLGSTQDAEDVLQEVFVNAYKAMLRDEREINLRPWLYRIARNRSLNHLRKPTADAQESMDMVPAVEASSTAERVHNREEFRQILGDVNKLPETQRSALLLREMDALSYEEIAAAMETTVPSVKSLLVRARISLAEASQARLLTCNEVHVELSEAAEGLRKVSAPVRRHIRECDECADFRSKVRSNEKMLAALFPIGPLIALKGFIAAKLGLGGASAGGAGAAGAGAGAGAGAATAGATAAGAGAAGAGAVGGVGAMLSGSGAAGGLGAIGGAIGTKAVAGVVTAAVLTAGAAVEVKQNLGTPAGSNNTPPAKVSSVDYAAPMATVAPAIASGHEAPVVEASAIPAPEELHPPAAAAPEATPPPVAVPSEEEDAAATTLPAEEEAGQSATTGGTEAEGIAAAEPSKETPGAHGATGTVVVTVSPPSTAPTSPEAAAGPPTGSPAPPPAPPAPPAEVTPPPATTPPPPTGSSGTASPDPAVDAEVAAPVEP